MCSHLGLEGEGGLQRRGGLGAAERRFGEQPRAQRLRRDGVVAGGKRGRRGRGGVLDRLVQPLAEPEEHAGEVVVGGREQLLVAFGLLDRLVEQRLGGAQVVVVAADEREPDQRRGPLGTGLQRRRDRLEHLARAAAVAALEQAEGRVAAAAVEVVACDRAG